MIDNFLDIPFVAILLCKSIFAAYERIGPFSGPTCSKQCGRIEMKTPRASRGTDNGALTLARSGGPAHHCFPRVRIWADWPRKGAGSTKHLVLSPDISGHDKDRLI